LVRPARATVNVSTPFVRRALVSCVSLALLVLGLIAGA
jgi:hypothetical protein